MNALKTGIDARSQIVPGELISDLQELTAEYYDNFQPTTPVQRAQVDILIDSEWSLRRLRRVDAQLWEKSHIWEETLCKAFREDSEVFARLQRRIDATQRNYRNALHELERLQAAHQAEEAAVPADPAPASPQEQNLSSENGFVPQPSPTAPSHPPQPPIQPPASAEHSSILP